MKFLFFLVVLGLLGVVAYALWQSRRADGGRGRSESGAGDAAAVEPPYESGITNVGSGGLIHLQHVGENMDSYDVSVVGRHRYREGSFEWHELEGETPDGKVWLDVEDDDEVAVSLVVEKLKLRDLGLNETALEGFADEEEGELSYQGRTYYYEEAGEAIFYRHGDEAQGARFEYWDFETDDGAHFLGVERWADGSVEAFYSQPVKLSQITVYSVGGANGHH